MGVFSQGSQCDRAYQCADPSDQALWGIDGGLESGRRWSIRVEISFGAGYRVYIALEGAALLLLLVGGTKSSQTKDIKLAKEIYESWRRDYE